MRTLYPVHCLILLGLSALVAGCGVGEAKVAAEPVEPEPAALPVSGVSVAVTDLYARFSATSTLTADGEAAVPARVAGEVVEILVEEGDTVVQGQLLARLDGQRLKLKAREAEARYRLRRSEFERQVELAERGLVSAAAFDSLKFEVDALHAAWQLEKLNHGYAEIRAPIGGVVASREITVGQHLEASDLAFRISDTSRLVAEIRIPQAELSRFAPGMPVTLVAEAAEPSSVDAVVDRISPTIDRETGTFRMTSYVDNENAALAPGMFVRLDVLYQKHENALALPASAIIEEDGEHVVYLVTEGRAERREVSLGARQKDLVQVIDGIRAGQTVVLHPGGLRDGTPVALGAEVQPAAGA